MFGKILNKLTFSSSCKWTLNFSMVRGRNICLKDTVLNENNELTSDVNVQLFRCARSLNYNTSFSICLIYYRYGGNRAWIMSTNFNYCYHALYRNVSLKSDYYRIIYKIKLLTVDVDPDYGQRWHIGRVECGETFAVYFDAPVSAQQFVVEQNRHLGDTVIAGH